LAQNDPVRIQNKNLRPIFVIIGLVAALAFTVYAMRNVRSAKFQQGLAIMFGQEASVVQVPPAQPSRPWTWCPKETQLIVFYVNRASEDSVTPEQICEIKMESVPAEKMNRTFKRYLTVGSGPLIKTLEADDTLEVFRVDGLIFQSASLTKTLRGH
jgi:hypothetical protein